MIDKETFIIDMVSTYKSKDEEVNKAFYAQLSTFAGKCKENHLKDVYDHIVRKHKFNTPFKLYLAYDFAEKNGYMIEAEKKQKKRDPIWLTCPKCKTDYSKTGRVCPKCGDPHPGLTTASVLPEYHIDVKEDCSYCTIYPEIKKNPNWMTSIGCNLYGKKQEPSCARCQCRECCRQMMMYRADRAGTTMKYKTGELAQPWLTYVKPINETAREMVEKMKKGIDISNVMR